MGRKTKNGTTNLKRTLKSRRIRSSYVTVSGGKEPPQKIKTSYQDPEEFFHLTQLIREYGGDPRDWVRLIIAGDLKAKKGSRTGDYLITRDSWRKFVVGALERRSMWLGRTKPAIPADKPTNEPNPGATMTTTIEVIPGVCGGDPVVAGTRIPVWQLEQMRRMGATAGQILDEYPTLRLGDIQSAWDYASTHRDEIDRQIHENEVA